MPKLFFSLIVFLIAFSGCGDARPEVVVYCSTDEIYARKIKVAFEKETNIVVKLCPDTESTKGAHFLGKIKAEKNSPVADVYWNNEISRTLALASEGLVAPYKSPSAKDIPDLLKDKNGLWTAFSARARVIVYNTEKVKPEDVPKSILDLTRDQWKNKVVFANPAAGTTASHVSAIFLQLGREKALEYFRKLKKNGARMVRSNSQVRDIVARGEAFVGLTDTDDVWVGIDQMKPIKMVYPDADTFGTLVIPNSVVLIKNAPHPEEAKKFIDFLLSRKIEEMLAQGKARQIPVRGGIPVPKGVKTLAQIKAMDLPFQKISDNLNSAIKDVQNIFRD